MDLKTSTWCTHSVISHSRWEGCELVSLLPQNLVLLSLSKRTNPCIILRFKPELVPTGFYQLWFLDKECPRILRSWQMIPSLAMINFVAWEIHGLAPELPVPPRGEWLHWLEHVKQEGFLLVPSQHHFGLLIKLHLPFAWDSDWWSKGSEELRPSCLACEEK